MYNIEQQRFNFTVLFNNITSEMSGLILNSVTIVGVEAQNQFNVTVNETTWNYHNYSQSAQVSFFHRFAF
jgi:hypothetical protein